MREKIQLQDDERTRIRWSSSKRGFVPFVEFLNGPRGGRFRPTRGAAVIGRSRGEDEARKLAARFRTPVRSVKLYEVDHLGRVQAETEVTR